MIGIGSASAYRRLKLLVADTCGKLAHPLRQRHTYQSQIPGSLFPKLCEERGSVDVVNCRQCRQRRLAQPLECSLQADVRESRGERNAG